VPTGDRETRLGDADVRDAKWLSRDKGYAYLGTYLAGAGAAWASGRGIDGGSSSDPPVNDLPGAYKVRRSARARARARTG